VRKPVNQNAKGRGREFYLNDASSIASWKHPIREDIEVKANCFPYVLQ
jgi:hypothetical protein